MSMFGVHPAYYQMNQPDGPWQAGSRGWTQSPWPTWGGNPNQVGPAWQGVNGLGGCAPCEAAAGLGTTEAEVTAWVKSGGKMTDAIRTWLMAQPCTFTAEEAKTFGDNAKAKRKIQSARELVANRCATEGVINVVSKSWAGPSFRPTFETGASAGGGIPWGWIALAGAAGVAAFVLVRSAKRKG